MHTRLSPERWPHTKTRDKLSLGDPALVTAVRCLKREFQERGVYVDLSRLEDLVRGKARTSHGSKACPLPICTHFSEWV
jgi:hypothetical protein